MRNGPRLLLLWLLIPSFEKVDKSFNKYFSTLVEKGQKINWKQNMRKLRTSLGLIWAHLWSLGLTWEHMSHVRPKNWMFLLHGQRRYWSTVPCLFWLLLSHLCLSRPKPSLNWGLCILLFMYVSVVREYMWEGKIWGQSLYIWFQIFSGKRFDLATCSVQKQLSRSSQMAPRVAMCWGGCHVAACASDFITIFVPSYGGVPRRGSHKGLFLGGCF